MISIIAAVSENNVIGNKGGIPWHLPRDFKYFKEITMGHPIVMGRKTFESIGKPLPKRENIILTRQNILIDGCTIVHDIEEIKDIAKNQEVFIIGGAEIYKKFLPLADKIYLTLVHTKVEGDTLFPEHSSNDWKCVFSEEHLKDTKNNFDITYYIYERQK